MASWELRRLLYCLRLQSSSGGPLVQCFLSRLFIPRPSSRLHLRLGLGLLRLAEQRVCLRLGPLAQALALPLLTAFRRPRLLLWERWLVILLLRLSWLLQLSLLSLFVDGLFLEWLVYRLLEEWLV